MVRIRSRLATDFSLQSGPSAASIHWQSWNSQFSNNIGQFEICMLPISTSQMSSSFTKKFYDKKLYQKLYQTCKTNRSNDGDNDSEAPRIAERSGEKKAVKGKVDVYKPYDACYEMFYEILAESSSVDVNWSNHKRWPHRRGALNF